METPGSHHHHQCKDHLCLPVCLQWSFLNQITPNLRLSDLVMKTSWKIDGIWLFLVSCKWIVPADTPKSTCWSGNILCCSWLSGKENPCLPSCLNPGRFLKLIKAYFAWLWLISKFCLSQQEAINLLEPMTNDPVNYVRQGALIASALIMIQQSEVTCPKVRVQNKIGLGQCWGRFAQTEQFLMS